jgi:hypothetical protein
MTMSTDLQVLQLVQRWEELQENGEDISAEELWAISRRS